MCTGKHACIYVQVKTLGATKIQNSWKPKAKNQNQHGEAKISYLSNQSKAAFYQIEVNSFITLLGINNFINNLTTLVLYNYNKQIIES